MSLFCTMVDTLYDQILVYIPQGWKYIAHTTLIKNSEQSLVDAIYVLILVYSRLCRLRHEECPEFSNPFGSPLSFLQTLGPTD